MSGVIIFAEPSTIISDGMVPAAARLIGNRPDLDLETIVDVSGGDPTAFTGRLAFLRRKLSRLKTPQNIAWRRYRRFRGFRNPDFIPYPSVLSWRGFPDSIHSVPPNGGVNDRTFVSKINSLEPEVILLLGCTTIIEPELMAIPRLGVINFHCSLLPDYRGRNVLYWQAYDRADTSGVTFHTITEAIDQGSRVAADRVPIRKGWRTLACDCLDRGRALLPTVLAGITTGTLPNEGKIHNGEYYSHARFMAADTSFAPRRGIDHNSRVVEAREELWVSFEDGPSVLLTGLARGDSESGRGEYGEVLTIERSGIKMNIGGEAHYLESLFHLPAYPIAKLLGVHPGMTVSGCR